MPREQTVFGIERLVDLTIAKNIPWLAYVTTIIVRFGNNVFGGCISGLGSQRQAACLMLDLCIWECLPASLPDGVVSGF